jgi:peptidoglycan/LPS O-acetylase OafA/YrhL
VDPRIDRLRGLLAIGVLLGHAIELAWQSTSAPAGILFSIATSAHGYFGFICVVGFIVLSGYCIARSTIGDFSLGRYAFKRVTRLYPLLIVVVLLTASVEWLAFQSPQRPNLWEDGLDGRHFLIALAGLSGFKGEFGALAPSYTISYELMYYLIWGLSMTVAVGRPRLGLAIASASAVLLLGFGDPIRAAIGVSAAQFVPALGVSLLPAWRLGAALALFQKPLTKVASFIPLWTMWFILAWVYARGFDQFQKPRTAVTDHTDVAYFAIMSILLVVTIASWLARPAPVQNATDTSLGEISYPLFLIHGPVLIGLQFSMNQIGFDPAFEVTLAILIAASLGASKLLAICVERPLMTWRRKFRLPLGKSRAMPAAEPV